MPKPTAITPIDTVTNKSPGRVLVVQQPLEQTTTWKIATVKAAIASHEMGDFVESGALVDSMGRSTRITSCLNTRVNALVSKNDIDFDICPYEGDTSDVAERVEAWWDGVCSDDTIKGIVKDVVMLGFHLSRIHWERTDNEWKPARLERWYPQNIDFDEQVGRYVACTTTGDVYVDPLDPNWLLVTSTSDRAWMNGAVRALGTIFVMSEFNQSDWARYNERHGMPLIAIKEPARYEPGTKDRFYRQFATLGSKGVLREPQGSDGQGGFETRFLEAKDRAYETFNGFKDSLNVAVAVLLLGQNLSTEVQGGSLAAAKVQELVRRDYLEADTELLSSALRDQLIQRWGFLNIPGWDPEKAPWPTWDTAPEADSNLQADTLNKTADAITKLQATGLPVDFEELLRNAHIPVVKGAKMPPPGSPAPAPAGGQKTGPGATKSTPAGYASHGHNHGPRAIVQPPRMESYASDSERGYRDGQIYADDLGDDGVPKARQTLSDLSNDLLTLVDAATDYEDLRTRVLAAYAARESPDRLRSIIHAALTLSELAGRLAVRQDATE